MSNVEDDLNELAPIGPAAWLYFARFSSRSIDALAILSAADKGCPVVFAPLLVDLTVDRDFPVSVRTPLSRYEDGVLTKVTSMCPFVAMFHNTNPILELLEDHGDVNGLCENVRGMFGLETYHVQDGRSETDINELCRIIGLDPNVVTGYVAFSNGMKEFLFSGLLVPCPEEATQVQLGKDKAVKVPLYPPTLFMGDDDIEDTGDFAAYLKNEWLREHAIYSVELSKAIFYFLFTPWAQALRFNDVHTMIACGMRQFVNDTQHAVKLAPHKRYYGYMTQKLSSGERDQLMLCDAAACELGFSYASAFFDSAYELPAAMMFGEWPIMKNCEDDKELRDRLLAFKLHLSSHIAAQTFSSNSVLYGNRIVFLSSANRVATGGSAQDGLMRAVQFHNGLNCLCEDAYNDSRKTVRFSGTATCKEDRFSAHHLAWACGTSPQAFSDLIWFFNRMPVYSTGTAGNVIFEHMATCSSGLCAACSGRCCHTCYQTAFVRMSSRLPTIPKQPKKEPFVVTMQSRYLSDVDVLGSFGRRHSNELKDSSTPMSSGVADRGMSGKLLDDGPPPSAAGNGTSLGAFPTDKVDRGRYLTQLFEYCKKNSLIDANTGEDAISIRGKQDFVSTITNLNRYVDELAMSFASEVRSKMSKEEVSGATQSFNLDMTPLSMVFCPVLSLQYYKTTLMIVQNLSLVSATSYVVDNPLTGSSIARWLNQHFQSICGAFSSVSARKGFLLTRDAKCSKSVEFEKLMDFKAYVQVGRYVRNTVEAKLCKLSVVALRSCRVKNRPLPRAGKTSGVNVFFKRDNVQKRSPIKGCLSFLLYRYHSKLFPGCTLSCYDLWHRICSNSVPRTVNLGNMDELGALLRFVVGVTADYSDHDLIDVQPENMLTYVEYRFHNKFLYFYGFREYLSTIHGLTTKLAVQNHLNFPYILTSPPKFSSVAEYAERIKEMKSKGASAPLAATVTRETLLRNVFEQRSLVSVAFSIEKYTSAASSRDVFQFAQIGYFCGSGVERCLNTASFGNQDYRYMRQRYVLATKLVDVILRRSRRDNVVFDADLVKNRVMCILDASNLEHDPEILVICEIMDGRNGEIPESDDILFYVDGQEALARSLSAKLDVLSKRGVTDYSPENVRQMLEAALTSNREPCDGGGEAEVSSDNPVNGMYDLSSVFGADASSNCTTPGTEVINVGEDFGGDFGQPAKRFRL